MMGCDTLVQDTCLQAELPLHEVFIGTFDIGRTEITQEQWQAVIGWNPSTFNTCLYCPVEYVSWEQIVNEFLPALFRKTGRNYRLPSEAEWEYAARGGNTGGTNTYSGGNDNDDLDAIAWYSGNARGKTQPVGLKKANELGVYDMTGNVREWCYDFYSSYPANAVANPGGRATGKDRILRGGRWDRNPIQLRSTYRAYTQPKYQDYGTGFRLTRRK